MNQFRTPIGPPPEPQEKFPEDEPFDDGPLEAAKAGAMQALLLMLGFSFTQAVGFSQPCRDVALLGPAIRVNR